MSIVTMVSREGTIVTVDSDTQEKLERMGYVLHASEAKIGDSGKTPTKRAAKKVANANTNSDESPSD